MTRRASRLACATVVALAMACGTRIPARDVPPLAISFGVSQDSARAILVAALRAERLPVDGGNVPHVVSSTYPVRRGGLGEGTIRIRFAVDPDNGGNAVIIVEAVQTERRRSMVLGGDRNPPVQPAVRPVATSDVEALRPLQRVLRRLEEAGGLLARSP